MAQLDISSRRRQISTTAAASSSRGHRDPRGHAAGAFEPRATAAVSTPARTSSEGTSHNCSLEPPPILRRRSPTPAPSPSGREDRLDQIARSVAHVLAVVEHQQPDPAFQCGGHTVCQALARLLGDARTAATASCRCCSLPNRGQL